MRGGRDMGTVGVVLGRGVDVGRLVGRERRMRVVGRGSRVVREGGRVGILDGTPSRCFPLSFSGFLDIS